MSETLLLPKARLDTVEAASETVHGLPSALLHDLRTPLNQILGYSQMLIDQAQEEGQDGYVPDLQNVRAAGLQLLAFINDNFHPILDNSHPRSPLPDRPGILDGDTTEAYSESAAGGDFVPTIAEGTLLVVDDNAANRDVLSRQLERQGYEVATADNGFQALELMHSRTFDLVLLDIMMPEMDGYEVLRLLKAEDRLINIPVIMISALNELDSVVRCIEMGAEDYLPKPFNPTLLKARIGACLEKKRAHDREIRFTEELQGSYRRLKELEQQRDDLTDMIVHDLRTPLTAVITGMQTVNLVGDMNEDQQEMLALALRGGQTLLEMINDLLDISKMESGSMQLDCKEISAEDLVGSTLQQVEPLAKYKLLRITAEIAPDLPRFTADHGKLLRILVNLVSNAIKFTPIEGEVRLTVRAADEARLLQFSIIDTGEGIPPEAFERIFEKFGQVETRAGGRKQSTGLGLTFCKLAVEAHGGRIWVESELGSGASFHFTIPHQPY